MRDRFNRRIIGLGTVLRTNTFAGDHGLSAGDKIMLVINRDGYGLSCADKAGTIGTEGRHYCLDVKFPKYMLED